MEQRQRESVNNHPLRREAVLPTSAGPSRPCLLVGLSLIALCMAASLDAFLWHQAREREDAEMRLQEVQSQARSLVVELRETREQLRLERAISNKLRDDAKLRALGLKQATKPLPARLTRTKFQLEMLRPKCMTSDDAAALDSL